MKQSIYEYLDYRDYVRDLLANCPRGERKRLAESLGCQMAFITHVLNEEKDFNHEQIVKIARHFHLGELESEYLLDLLSFNRAGTPDLRKIYKNRLESKREHHRLLKNRLKGSQSMSIDEQTEYYSHWLYGALHMAATVPALQSVPAMARHFHIEESLVLTILKFLVARGLVEMSSGQIRPGQAHLYVGKDSPLVNQNHAIWRLKALHDLKSEETEDFHYTLCFSASARDWPLIREKMVRAIEDTLAVIKPSPEEKLGLLCVDFQKV